MERVWRGRARIIADKNRRRSAPIRRIRVIRVQLTSGPDLNARHCLIPGLATTIRAKPPWRGGTRGAAERVVTKNNMGRTSLNDPHDRRREDPSEFIIQPPGTFGLASKKMEGQRARSLSIVRPIQVRPPAFRMI